MLRVRDGALVCACAVQGGGTAPSLPPAPEGLSNLSSLAVRVGSHAARENRWVLRSGGGVRVGSLPWRPSP